MQMTHKSKHNNARFTKWLEILAGEDFPQKFLWSENVDLKSSASNVYGSEGNAVNRETEATATTNIYRGGDKILKYWNYTENETDEERDHQLPIIQDNRIRNESDGERQRLKFTFKLIFFDTTIGSKNLQLHEEKKMHTRNIFPADRGQPISLLTIIKARFCDTRISSNYDQWNWFLVEFKMK